MKKNNIINDSLKHLLKENATEQPSAGFVDRLTYLVVHSYKRSYSAKYKKEERLGKVILLALVGCNLWMLYKLNVFSRQPALFVLVAVFVLLCWFCIWVIKRKIVI